MVGEPEPMKWVVRREIESYLMRNPGSNAREVWPQVASQAAGRLDEPVSEAVVAGEFWVMHYEGLVDYSDRGRLWMKFEI